MSKPNSQIPDFLFQIAQGFYNVGLNCASDPFKDKDIKGLQRIATGAVNLSFASELLLKGLLLITSKRTAWGHNLESLFNELDKPIKDEIEKHFIEFLAKDKDDKSIGSFKMSVSKAEKKSSGPTTVDDSLSYFLKTHAETFKLWRYLYDIGKDGYELEMNFRSMHCFIKAMITVVNSTAWKQKYYPAKE
jgi:hypothetical protein